MSKVTVELVEGKRWQVTGSNGHLLTQGCTARDWAMVERHVRHGMEQPTAAERWASQMEQLVERHGVDHPLGAAAQSALIESGLG